MTEQYQGFTIQVKRYKNQFTGRFGYSAMTVGAQPFVPPKAGCFYARGGDGPGSRQRALCDIRQKIRDAIKESKAC